MHNVRAELLLEKRRAHLGRPKEHELDGVAMLTAKGERDVWFASVEGLGYLPCTSHVWVKRTKSIWMYDDLDIKNAKDPQNQMSRYAREIRERKLVCHTISRPKDGRWTRLGYDAVWQIVPVVVTDDTVRFRFERQIDYLRPRAERYSVISLDPAHL